MASEFWDIKQIRSALVGLQKRTKRHRHSLERQTARGDFNDAKHEQDVRGKLFKLDHMLGQIEGALGCLGGSK